MIFTADLRAHLTAVINTSHGYNEVAASSPSPHGHNIDPAIAGQDMMSGSAESGGDDSMGDGRKGGKRELSQSKRAAQNRAAQVRPRPFRCVFATRSERKRSSSCLEVAVSR
jgi:hypothetical protein